MANLLKSAATQRLTKKAQKEKNFAAISGLVKAAADLP